MTTQVDQIVRQLRAKLHGEAGTALRDAELLECFIRARADAAFAVLVERHGPMVLGVCERILQDRHDAEDAFQATFLVLARRAAAIRKPDSLASWLYGIARRLALDMKRKTSQRRDRERRPAAAPTAAPVDPALRELHLALDDELQRLPHANRLPLLLCYLQGLTQEEAARNLGWPRGTLKRRLERGRALLKLRLTRRGLSLGVATLAALPAEHALAAALPRALVAAAARAALVFAAGSAATVGSAPARVIALAQGVLRSMAVARVSLLALLLLMGLGLGILGVVLGGPHQLGREEERTAAPVPPQEPAGTIAVRGETPGKEINQPETPDAAVATTRRFEALAADLAMFPTGDFAHGRADQVDRLIPRKLTDAWLKVYAALHSKKHDVATVVALLKHKDARVRTLALGALFDRQDPRDLPHIAALVGDQAKTVPEIRILRAIIEVGRDTENLVPEDYHAQTVGDVAKVFLDAWLEPVGYRVKDFDLYWAVRKDRPFCAGWFLERLYYAGQHTTAFDEKRGAPLIRGIRSEIDALPAVDREWTLLWVAAHQGQLMSERPVRLLATPDERVAAAKRLGPDRLMALLEGKDISSDPDLAPQLPGQQRGNLGRGYLVGWVLRHAGKLLRSQDADAILAIGKRAGDRSPWYALAAAELQPAHARAWLHEAMDQNAGGAVYSHRAWNRAEIAAGLWRIVGTSEIDYLADWFYAEKVATNPHSPQTGQFLESIKGVRAPADRTLVARLVDDPRLERLDYQSLRALIEVVNGWTRQPVVDRSGLYPNWERGSWGPETDRDKQVLATWRSKLRNSKEQWLPR